jgi:hypothetical protein
MHKLTDNLCQWCDRCTQWKEANEPSVTPMPAPNTTVAPDEEGDVLGTGLQIYADGIEGGSDSDVSKEIYLPHIHS